MGTFTSQPASSCLRSSRRRYFLICGALAVVSLCGQLAGEKAAASTTDVTNEQLMVWLQPFLFQDIKWIDGERYMAAYFGHAKNNTIARAGLSLTAKDEAIRQVVEADYREFTTEYLARGMISQRIALGRFGANGSDEQLQQQLWDNFSADARYRTRMIARLQGRPVPPRQPGSASLAEVARMLEAIKTTLRELPTRSGCGTNPITAFSTIASGDAMLASDIYEYVVAADHSSAELRPVREELEKRGWTLVP